MKPRYFVGATLITGLFAFLPLFASAQMVEQTNAWTIVRTAAAFDGNTTFYAGTSTVSETISDIGVYLGDPSFTGIDVFVRITCFANQFNSSQTGCTDTSVHTSDTEEVLNPTGQVYYFTLPTPIVTQVGKVYVLEIMTATASDNIDVYGDSSYQFNNQCNFAGGATDCTAAPYWVTNAVPNWSGINATSTALTSMYQDGATTTLALITERCAESSNVFSSAMCATVTFLFIPSPDVLNNYIALPDTVAQKFPFSWYYGIKGTFDGLVATTSTSSMATLAIDFSSVDPATSTPFGPILPNATLLSAATITTYLTPGILATLLNLEAFAMWVLFGLFLFHDVQRRWFRH